MPWIFMENNTFFIYSAMVDDRSRLCLQYGNPYSNMQAAACSMGTVRTVAYIPNFE